MRMKLETELMREKAREERNQRRLEGLMRIFAMIFAFVAGMTFMVIVMRPEAKGVWPVFLTAMIGGALCGAGGEPK